MFKKSSSSKAVVRAEGSAGSGAGQATTLGSGNLRAAVALPEGEDVNEWLAVAAVDFFHQVNMLYATLADFCTPDSCPSMSAGPKYKYFWSDGQHKPEDVCASRYVFSLMEWIQEQLEDETVFPTKPGNAFPKGFHAIVNSIFRRLFRVFAHIYHHHVEHVQALDISVHLNTSFRHFCYFVDTFQLIEKKELAPLSELIASFSGGGEKKSKKR